MSKALETHDKVQKEENAKASEVENKSSTPNSWPLGQLLEEKVLRGQVQVQAEQPSRKSKTTQLMV